MGVELLLTLGEDDVDSVMVDEVDGEDAAGLLDELVDVVVVVVMKIVCCGLVPAFYCFSPQLAYRECA